MTTLNEEQFHSQVLQGGASRHSTTGVVPDRGYMVGSTPTPSGEPFPEQVIPADKFSVADVQRHAEAIHAAFGSKGIYQGGWKEGDNVVLDASQSKPSRRRALQKAKKRGERAIYDVKGGQEIYT